VILAGRNTTIYCYYRKVNITPYWHFYGLTSGATATPCGFYRVYPGISRCQSASRTSLKYLPYYHNHNKTTLTITNVQLSDAGTYSCGERNPYDRSMTRFIIFGVIGESEIIIHFTSEVTPDFAKSNFFLVVSI